LSADGYKKGLWVRNLGKGRRELLYFKTGGAPGRAQEYPIKQEDLWAKEYFSNNGSLVIAKKKKMNGSGR